MVRVGSHSYSAPPHEVQNECDEDKTHEVNSEMKVLDILEEGNGKICYAHACTVDSLLLNYFSHNYNAVISL